MRLIMGFIGLVVLAMIAIIQPEIFFGGAYAVLAITPIWGLVADKTFKELKAEDVAKLSADDQIKYFNELNIHKADQMLAFKIQLKKEHTEELEKQVADLRIEINDNTVKQMESIQKAMEIQGEAINRLMTSDKVPSQKSIEDYLYAVKDDLKKAREKTVTIKTDVTSASLANSAFALDIPGVGQLAHLTTKLLGLFASGSIGDGQGGVVRFVDQAAVTRSADWEAETDVKAESAITWVTTTVPLETIADTIPVTNQALSNIPFIAAEIRNFLLTNLDLKIDEDLFSGTGVAPEIDGIYTQAVEFVAVASGVTDPNVYDLISFMLVNLTAATSYDPNYILMNPTDVNKYLQLKKDGNNNYMLPPFVEMRGSQMFIHGMEVIKTSVVTADTMLVGDFTKATVFTHGGIKLDVGLIDKQFVENMVTIRAEQELGLVVRTVHLNAFNKETGIAAGLVTIGT
jgi:hypothetical protein